jgi:hypothetical protein
MGRSLAVVLVFTIVVVLAGPGRVLLFPGHHPGAASVGYTAQARQASRAAGVAMPVPTVPPAGWIATAVSVVPGPPVYLHLGFQTAGGEFAALDESAPVTAAQAGRFVQTQLAGGRFITRVAGWRWWAAGGGQHALTRVVDRVAIVIVGTASQSDLLTLAASLR